MTIEIDDQIINQLIQDYRMCSGDGSYWTHIASYLIECLEDAGIVLEDKKV